MKGKFSDSKNPSDATTINGFEISNSTISINDSISPNTTTIVAAPFVPWFETVDPAQARQMAMIVRSGDVDAFRKLVEGGSKLYCLDFRSYSVLESMHPIIYAAYLNKVNILKYLVEELKTDLSIQHDGHTAVYCAIKNKCLEALQYLIGHDDINVIPKGYSENLTPLQYAVEFGFTGGVKLLIESGANCNIAIRSQPSEHITNLIKLGSFVQSLCLGHPALHGIDDAIKEMLAHSPEGGPMLEFAVTAMTSSLKKGASSNCLKKIETCDFLPDAFKTCLLNAIYPIFNVTQESLESLDAELLGQFMPYSIACKSVSSTYSDSNEFEVIKKVFEQYDDHKTPGFCTEHFAKTLLADNLSQLAGCMKLRESIKESVELLLGQAITAQARKLFSEALKQCNACKLPGDVIENLIEKAQASPEEFYPSTTTTKAAAKKVAEAEEKAAADPHAEADKNAGELDLALTTPVKEPGMGTLGDIDLHVDDLYGE